MIIVETKIINNLEYKYTYSDSNKKILQKETNIVFEDALDYKDSVFTYEEIDLEKETEE